jgi:hypothetical protein
MHLEMSGYCAVIFAIYAIIRHLFRNNFYFVEKISPDRRIKIKL